MKTKLLIILAVFLVLIPWILGFGLDMNYQVIVGVIPTSTVIVMIITILFSLLSWFLLSWVSQNIKPVGIFLSIITATSLILPFFQVLGPMTGVIVGIAAGFAAFMLQKKMINPTENKSLIIATIVIVIVYFVLIALIVVSQTASWDNGNGIGEWTGTAEGMEKSDFNSVLRNSIDLIFFLITIPSLIITGLITQSKKK